MITPDASQYSHHQQKCFRKEKEQGIYEKCVDLQQNECGVGC